MTETHIAVIVGSVRAKRIGMHVAQWVGDIGRDAIAQDLKIIDLEIIDLKAWSLPFDDEPAIPAHGSYVHEHTKAWSRKIAGFGAFVFVTPQYNWGYPAALKNALDHLYREWSGKPALIVSYGGHGGDKCATQLRHVLDGLKMKPVATMPALTISRDQVAENTGEIDAATAFAANEAELRKAFAELSAALAEIRIP